MGPLHETTESVLPPGTSRIYKDNTIGWSHPPLRSIPNPVHSDTRPRDVRPCSQPRLPLVFRQGIGNLFTRSLLVSTGTTCFIRCVSAPYHRPSSFGVSRRCVNFSVQNLGHKTITVGRPKVRRTRVSSFDGDRYSKGLPLSLARKSGVGRWGRVLRLHRLRTWVQILCEE